MQLFSLSGFGIAALLLLSFAAKAQGSFGRELATRSALSALIPRGLALTTARIVTVSEAGIAVALVVAPARYGGGAAAIFFLGATAYAGRALHAAPDRPCGCFGSGAPISWKVPIRALFLTAVAAAYAVDRGQLGAALRSPVAWAGLVAFAGVTTLLSPETRALHWMGARGIIPTCWRCRVAIDDVTDVLHRTMTWKALERYITAERRMDSWREGCWQFVSYEAVYNEKIATALFALRLPPGRTICHGMLRRGLAGAEILTPPQERVRWPRAVRLSSLGWLPGAPEVFSSP